MPRFITGNIIALDTFFKTGSKVKRLNMTGICVERSDIIGHWAQENINKLVQGKVISGYPDNSFKPQGNTTRAEAVTVIAKMMKS